MARYDLRSIVPEEVGAWAACASAAFGIRIGEHIIGRDLAAYGAERTIAAFDGTEIVGTAASFGVELTLPGGTFVPAAAVYGVTVMPSHRRQGILTSMMERQLPARYEAGDEVALLTASEGAIYGRFGYGVASHACRYEVDKRVARLARPVAELAPGTVRMITAGQAEEVFPPLWDIARRQRPAEISMPPEFWHEQFHELEFRGIDEKRRFCAVYDYAGTIDGCVDYQVTEDAGPPSQRIVDVHLIVAVGSPAYAALCNFLLSIDLTAAVRLRHRPLDEPLRELLADRRHLRMTFCSDDIWARPLDVAALLRARRYAPLPGRLVLEVRDRLCPWNEGIYELVVDGEGAAAVSGPESGGDADVTLDAAGLGSVVLGGGRFSRLVRSGRATENTAGATWRADALFSADVEPFSTMSF